MQAVKVWDLPTRVFHWALAALVITDFFVAEDEGLEFLIHSYAGYAVGLLLLFRLAWGVIGSRHARFADFIYPWSETRAYISALMRLKPPAYVGHNPLGGLMIFLMLAVLLFIVASGMAAAVGEGATIPFMGWLPGWLAEAMEDVHEVAGNIMIGLAAVHVVGVLADWLLTRDNIVGAMISGKKHLDEEAAAAEPRMAGVWRAVAIALPLILLGGYMVQQSDFSATAEEHEEREHERDD